MKREYKYDGYLLLLKCTCCGERLTQDKFNKDKSKSFGLRTNCRECQHKSGKIYRMSNKEKIIENVKRWGVENKDKTDSYKRKYAENNRDRINLHQRESRKIKNLELGFSLDSFHHEAINLVNKKGLRPTVCPICGSDKNIVMHHPSYDSFDMWGVVVFCCQMCHMNIHAGNIACPEPINLLDL